TAGIGTPQARWREIHQSGRPETMLRIRSRPHDGTHVTSLSIALSAEWRSVSPARLGRGASIRMNHCDVARKITGLWQRQQCGYECAKVSRWSRRPPSLNAASLARLDCRKHL